MEGEVRVVSEPATLRAACAVLTPILYPVVLAIDLATSGHSLTDYPRLIAAGDLALAPQSIGWVCIVAYAFLYIPPALTALRRAPYIATSNDALFLPSGERMKINDILEISLKRGFWQRYMVVRTSGGVRKSIVTFAKEDLAVIRSTLEDDPDIRGVRIAS
jgi:hypothetical protein